MRNETTRENGTELGSFLMSRRSRLRPQDIGLPRDDKFRRVAGLRREEVALMAGVSVNYYTRLEQGQNRNASPEVLDALASALRLSHDERAHLHALGRPQRSAPAPAPTTTVRPELTGLIESFTNGPAVLLGRQTSVLAWNYLARALFTGYIDLRNRFGKLEPPNLGRLIFLHPHAGLMYPDWQGEAEELVGYLRVMVGRYPDDPCLAALVRELSEGSAKFAELWSGHVVGEKTYGTRMINHPVVGRLTLSFETLRLPDAPDQCIVLYQAKPGSASETAIRTLLERRISG